MSHERHYFIISDERLACSLTILDMDNQPFSYPPEGFTVCTSPVHSVDIGQLERHQQEFEKTIRTLQHNKQYQHISESERSRKNNWPALPSWIPFGPCFYQDFGVDIPIEHHKSAKCAYYLWCFYAIDLLFNFVGCMILFIHTPSGGKTFGISILWAIIVIPSSFVCWYRPVYKAFRSSSSFNFLTFFFIVFFHIIITIIQASGLTPVTVGIINGIEMLDDDVAVGVVMILVGVCFSGQAVGAFLLLFRVHQIYRGSGASLQKAQEEFVSGKWDASVGVSAS